MKTLIIIPAYNEAESIRQVVDNLKKNYPEVGYVVINDCSRDKTSEICHRHGFNRGCPRLRGISKA